MDETVRQYAKRLQDSLDAIDSQSGRDTLVWAHGFLSGVLNRIERRIPDLIEPKTTLEDIRGRLRSWTDMSEAGQDPSDSLDKIEREMEGLDDSPVPARRKPGPKGLTGGAAARLPDADLSM